jgi:hypothetical protein
MSDTPKDDEAKFNETLKRMLNTPPTPHKDKAGAGRKPAQRPRRSGEDAGDDDKQPRGRRRKVD